MSDPDGVFDVSGWEIAHEETVGASEKSWLRDPEAGSGLDGLWLFKPVVHHDNGTVQGGDWAELLASRVAELLGVRSAEIRMAVRDDKNGTLSRNVRPSTRWDRYEGSLWLDADPGVMYKVANAGPSRRKGGASPGYSLETIASSLREVGAPPGAGSGYEELDGFDNFCGFLVLDALISNRDRHEQNWSVLRPAVAGGDVLLAAAYDNEGSFGYNLTDAARETLLDRANGMSGFSQKGTAWRYDWGEERVPDLVGAATIGLRLGTERVRSIVRDSVETFAVEDFVELARAVPRMSEVARNFGINLLQTNLERLRDGLRDLGSR